jgi:molybdopterin converting factor subunit 1
MITLLYFAAVRERLGRERELVSLDVLPQPATIEMLWGWLTTRHPDLSPWRSHLRFALNMELCDAGCVLKDGDEVAIIPPVSGGQDEPVELSDDEGRLRITSAPLDARLVETLVAHSGAGGLVTFTGTVRDHTGDHLVNALHYEAYPPMVLKTLRLIVEELHAQWPLARVSVHHRVGRLDLGDAAVVIAVATPHRAEAFAACQHAIDRMKQIVPIWKKEIGHDGQHWVGMGP